MNKKQPHKHAELIKAWADGAEIEYFSKTTLEWCLITVPTWADNAEFRIKPKPDVVEYRCVLIGGAIGHMRGGNLKLTFDGETGKLKSAEVL